MVWRRRDVAAIGPKSMQGHWPALEPEFCRSIIDQVPTPFHEGLMRRSPRPSLSSPLSAQREPPPNLSIGRQQLEWHRRHGHHRLSLRLMESGQMTSGAHVAAITWAQCD